MSDQFQAAVAAEITQLLNGSFQLATPIEFEFAHDGALDNGRFAAVVWKAHVKHTGVLVGIQPTGRVIWIRGCTILRHSDPAPGEHPPKFDHFVDWGLVMTKLGVGITGRPLAIDA